MTKKITSRSKKVVAEAEVPVEALAPVEDASVKWKRRLRRLLAKAEAQGVDARALMEEVLAA
jgi:hypothetical protein